MWPEGEEARKAYIYFTSYMTEHLNLVAEYGYWPHYRRQAISAGIPFDESTIDLSLMEPPRHMIQKWRVAYMNDVPVSAMPVVWAAFSPLSVYPDARTEAFALREAARRQNNLDRAISPGAPITSDGKIMCVSDRVVDTTQQPAASNDFPSNDVGADGVANRKKRSRRRGGRRGKGGHVDEQGGKEVGTK